MMMYSLRTGVYLEHDYDFQITIICDARFGCLEYEHKTEAPHEAQINVMVPLVVTTDLGFLFFQHHRKQKEKLEDLVNYRIYR